MPGVRRILCNNPGPFTFKGTVSYIVGRGPVAIIDPGPLDEPHIAALLDAVRGETVTHIFVTHTHRDHSPACGAHQGRDRRADLRRRSASRRRGRSMSARRRGSNPAATATSVPTRALRDGDVVAGDGWTLEAIATPGHTANHMAFALKEREHAVLRRPRDGLVDAGGGAARRRDERLHGLARQARAPPGADLFPRPRRRGARCAAFRAALHPPPPGPRAVDPAPPRQGRDRHPDAGARDLYRARSAADQGGRALGAGASGGSGRRAGWSSTDGAPSIERPLSLGRSAERLWPGPFAFFGAGAAGCSGFCVADRVVDVVEQGADTRAALVPKSNEP